MGLEYFYRWIQPSWPPAASWRRPARRLYDCSGLFPLRRDIYLGWAGELREALPRMDVLAQWQPPLTYLSVVEDRLLTLLSPQVFRAHRDFIQPLHQPARWLGDLPKLRWLVIHPFEKTIRAQLPSLARIGVYPTAATYDLECRSKDTKILACPQFAYMNPPRHRDWMHALAEMKAEMERQKDLFDIALIGAGAWSLPLAAHAKKIGRKAIHLGGTLQLLFGIRGARFDQWGFDYHQAWVRPLAEETPPNCYLMEGGAYW